MSDEGALKQHMVKHTGMKNFYCHICGKTLTSQQSPTWNQFMLLFSLHSAPCGDIVSNPRYK